MKTHLILAALTLLTASAVWARGGDVEGNGGYGCARDFARMGRIVYDVVSKNDYFSKIVDLRRLDHVVNNASISVVHGELRDAHGGTAVAVNDGVSKIYLSYDLWCSKSYTERGADITFHEYLGIAMPGRDQQYQISGMLYARTGLDALNFHRYHETGTDFSVDYLAFSNMVSVTSNSVVLHTYQSAVSHDKKKATITCEKGNERMELVYLSTTSYDRKKQSYIYKEWPLQTYRFASIEQCNRTLRKAILEDGSFVVKLGQDTLTVLGFN